MFKGKFFLVIITVICLMASMTIIANANLLAECDVCNATGKCDNCNGEKTVKCDNCNGTETIICDQCQETGKITCHICNGTGKYVDNPEENCPQCEGTGKEICNSCKGNITVICHNCVNGKKICNRCNGDTKCKSCKGTGYKDGQTNGITNIPKKGDTVQLLSGEYIKWGVTESDKNDNPPAEEKSNQTIVKEKENNPVPTKTEENNKPVENDNPIVLEQNSNLPIMNEGEAPQVAVASMNVENMNEKYKNMYNTYTKEEINNIFNDVNKIVETAKINNTSDDVQNLVKKVLKNNNINENEDAKVCIINFDGHMSIDFPVKVTVNIDKDIYSKDEIIYAYHVVGNNDVECLGEAEKVLENNKVVAIAFETTGFSDFFLSTEKLNIETNSINGLENETITTGVDVISSTATNSSNNFIVIGTIALIFIVCIVLVVAVITKKGKNEKN